MQYRKLPHGGDAISIIGLGTSSIQAASEQEPVHTAGQQIWIRLSVLLTGSFMPCRRIILISVLFTALTIQQIYGK